MTKVDLMIFGATGYTGKYVVRELATTYKNENITWAVAGRSASRLDNILESISNEKNVDLSNIEKFIVDSNDIDSVRNMCDNSKIVINCVGPYRFTGEDIVKQCIASNTHHIDVSGEPEFLEKMQLKYDTEAQEKNVFVIGSCGFDSIPADMGVVFTQKMFKNDLEYIESYLSFEAKNIQINYATWESAVYGFGASKALSFIRKQLFKFRIPKPKYPAPKRTNKLGYFFDSLSKKYCMDFMGSDKSIVQRTQYFNYETLNKKSVQYVPYFTINKYLTVLTLLLYGLNFGIMANFKFGRHLLLKYHNFFSGGLVSKLESKIESNQNFTMQFRGVGHDKKIENKTEQHGEKPDQTIITECSGPDAYVSTSIFVLDSALTLLQEKEKIPVKGGVLTPGAAFGNTNLIERLTSHGIKFDVIYNGPKKIILRLLIISDFY